MKNAHLRIAAAELRIETEHTTTRVKAFSDLMAQETSTAETHALSIFGGDTEMAAFAGAISMGNRITLTVPDGSTHTVSMGNKAVVYRGSFSVPGRERPLRHLLALSQAITQNGLAGSVYLLQDDPELIWAMTASLLGVPATPEWGSAAVEWLTNEGKIAAMTGFGCSPVKITVTRDEILDWIGKGVKNGSLPFPEKNGPVRWPAYGLDTLLSRPETEAELVAA